MKNSFPLTLQFFFVNGLKFENKFKNVYRRRLFMSKCPGRLCHFDKNVVLEKVKMSLCWLSLFLLAYLGRYMNQVLI